MPAVNAVLPRTMYHVFAHHMAFFQGGAKPFAVEKTIREENRKQIHSNAVREPLKTRGGACRLSPLVRPELWKLTQGKHMYRDAVAALRRLLYLQDLRCVHLLRRLLTRLLLGGLCLCIANVVQHACTWCREGKLSVGSTQEDARRQTRDNQVASARTRSWLVDLMARLTIAELVLYEATGARSLMDLEETEILRRLDLTERPRRIFLHDPGVFMPLRHLVQVADLKRPPAHIRL